MERKGSDFGTASWRIVLGGIDSMENTHRMSKPTTRFVKKRRPFASPHQGERPKALYPCSRPLYLLHRKRRPLLHCRSACYISFRIHPVDSARESPVCSSALGRENSISGAVRDWNRSCR